MKHAKLLSLFLIIIAFEPAAFSQDAIMVLNHDGFGKHRKPPVMFDHEFHAAKIDCMRCHHDFDAYCNNRGGEGQQCAGCHDVRPDDGSLSLMEAFHLQCKGCHETFRLQGRKAGGITCGECHVRK